MCLVRRRGMIRGVRICCFIRGYGEVDVVVRDLVEGW